MAEAIPKKQSPALTVGSEPATLFKKALFRRFTVLGAAVALMLVLLLTLFSFIRNEVSEIKKSEADRQWFIKSLDVIAKLNATREEAGVLTEGLESVFPTAIQVPTKVVSQIQAQARAYDLKVSFRLGTVRPPSELDFVLGADGLLENIIGFLKAFENGKIVRVNSWALSPSPAPSEYNLTLDGTMYTRGE